MIEQIADAHNYCVKKAALCSCAKCFLMLEFELGKGCVVRKYRESYREASGNASKYLKGFKVRD